MCRLLDKVESSQDIASLRLSDDDFDAPAGPKSVLGPSPSASQNQGLTTDFNLASASLQYSLDEPAALSKSKASL
eukprot:scaffold79020_cov29-Prasinocladus_malaysianus.AAC.1